MNVAQALAWAKTQIHSDSARFDAELLLGKVLSRSLTWLKTWPDQLLSESELTRFSLLVERRSGGEPVAYILGEQGFWSLHLKTDPSTLIPRPETERLVEIALDLLAKVKIPQILDLGSGTGAIALALAVELPQAKVFGCDLSPQAVDLAQSNAKANGLERVSFFQSNWFDKVAARAGEGCRFDLIVSNPPYLDPNDPHLDQGDVRFEPKSALVSAQQGLADIDAIINTAPNYLKPGAFLMFEHGFEQAKPVQDLLKKAGFCQVQTFQDLAGLDRVTLGFFSH